MRKIIVSFLSLLIVGCASAPDFVETDPVPTQARVFFYQPHDWQTVLGKHRVFLNDKEVVILKDSGYFMMPVAPGPVKIITQHAQNSEEARELRFIAEKGVDHYVKVDSTSAPITFTSLTRDVLAISTLVGGAKAEMDIKSGNGTFGDVQRHLSSQQIKDEMNAPSAKEARYHRLFLMKPALGVLEIRQCSSKNAEPKSI